MLADGTTATGQAACDGVQAQSGVDKLDITGMGVPPATYLSLLAAGAAPTHPAEEQMRFERFFNTQYSLAPFYRGTALEGRIATLPTDIRPGLYPTPANAYIGGYADRSFGPDPDGHNILVLRGKLPTHPDTFRRNPHTESGTQVRYWSLCNYGSNIANPPLAPVNTDCLFDEQIPTDDDGNYEIVISLTEDRPAQRHRPLRRRLDGLDHRRRRRRRRPRPADPTHHAPTARRPHLRRSDRQDRHPRHRRTGDGRLLPARHLHDRRPVRTTRLPQVAGDNTGRWRVDGQRRPATPVTQGDRGRLRDTSPRRRRQHVVEVAQSPSPGVSAEELASLRSPDTLETPFGTMEFFDGVPLPETVERATTRSICCAASTCS